MDWKPFLTVFASILLLELGDKTQVATLLYASQDGRKPATVFAAASLALVVAAGIGVLAGTQISRWTSPLVLRWTAGVGFIAVGVWTLLRRG